MGKDKVGSWIKYLTIIFLFFIITTTGTAAGVAHTYIKECPDLSLEKFDYPQTSVILDQNGEFYQELQGKEKRECISISEVPDHVKNAFIAIEDERFYEHFGVDIKGIIRAAYQGVKEGNLTTAGGSTITQQLIKLTHLSPAKKLSRKIKETYLSISLERIMSKDKILENYLNKINFAYSHGIQAASKTYFNKEVNELSVAQAAVLAAIPKAPTHYKPYIVEKNENGHIYIKKDKEGNIIHSPKNKERALIIIEKMKELGFIGEDDYRTAKNQLYRSNVGLIEPKEAEIYSYFTDALYEQLVSELMKKYFSDLPKKESREKAVNLLLNGGLKIYSTIDVDIQEILDRNFANDKLFPKQSSTAKKASKEKSRELNREIEYRPEGSMVIIENSTGHVKGIIGGREKKSNLSLNRGLRAFQVGSSTKPLTVYAPGIDSKKITLATTYDDVPIVVGKYKPNNAGKSYSGMTTIRNGLYRSKNIIAVQAWYDIGLETSVEYGEKFGLSIIKEGKVNDMGPAALALGGYTHGQTPLAMASAYTVFPNQGVRREPTFFTKVVDSRGNIILESNNKDIQVISPQTAFLLTDVLKDVPRGGTTSISISNFEIAGKTGTTDNQMHAWFIGFTPYYTAAVWYGYDENTVFANGKRYNLNIGIYGGSKPGPASMWESVMGEIHENLKIKHFPKKPKGIVTAKIDTVSGKLPTSLSYRDPRGSRVKIEYFIKGTVPNQRDNYHVSIGNQVYIIKPGNRFPTPIKPANPSFHPENKGRRIVITPSQRKEILKNLEEKNQEKEQEQDKRKGEEKKSIKESRKEQGKQKEKKQKH